MCQLLTLKVVLLLLLTLKLALVLCMLQHHVLPLKFLLLSLVLLLQTEQGVHPLPLSAVPSPLTLSGLEQFEFCLTVHESHSRRVTQCTPRSLGLCVRSLQLLLLLLMLLQ